MNRNISILPGRKELVNIQLRSQEKYYIILSLTVDKAKNRCKLSIEKLISSAQTDMAYKYLLDLDPEAKIIDPSLITKFRKTRITEDILEEMLRETVRQAIEKE